MLFLYHAASPQSGRFLLEFYKKQSVDIVIFFQEKQD